MKVFEYVIVEHPTAKERKEHSNRSKIVAGPEAVLASDEKAAAILAGRAIPEALIQKLDHIEVSIRSF